MPGDPWKMTGGKVSWVQQGITYQHGQKVDARVMSIAAEGRYGDSGGPVVNEDGELVGIHVAGTGTRSWAIELDELKAILAEARSKPAPGGWAK